MWTEIGKAVIRCIHAITGWFIHPEKGGCCNSGELINKKGENENE